MILRDQRPAELHTSLRDTGRVPLGSWTLKLTGAVNSRVQQGGGVENLSRRGRRMGAGSGMAPPPSPSRPMAGERSRAGRRGPAPSRVRAPPGPSECRAVAGPGRAAAPKMRDGCGRAAGRPVPPNYGLHLSAPAQRAAAHPAGPGNRGAARLPGEGAWVGCRPRRPAPGVCPGDDVNARVDVSLLSV